MKTIKLILLCLLFSAFFSAGAFGKFVELSNDYLKMGVDDASGRYTLETVEGEPGSSGDNLKSLLYKKTPLTSYTTVSINDEYFVFGSDSGNFLRRPYIQNNKIITGWEIKNILVIQELSLTRGSSTGLDDTMFVTYKILNKNRGKAKIGIRLLLDVLTGGVKPRAFGIPGQGNIEKETIIYRDQIPPYWFCFDNYDNPVIRAQGTLIGYGNTKPDKIIFASWDRFYDNPWDFPVDSKKDFRRLATPEYDSSVALFFEPVEVDSEKNLFISASYGMYGTSFFTDKDILFSLSVPNDPGHPPIPVNAEFVNQSVYPLDRLQMELVVPRGFHLDTGETNVLNFMKVKPNEKQNVLWHLNSGSIGGNFKVVVNAVTWQLNKSNSIKAEKDFYINYSENLGVPTNVPAKIQPKPDQKPIPVIMPPSVRTNVVHVTNQMVTVEEMKSEMSDEEKQLILEIRELDKLIAEINKKYQVLMGIYKNVYVPNTQFIQEIDGDIRKYESELINQESILSNQKEMVRYEKGD